MRSLTLTLLISPWLALAEPRSTHERLVAKYEEPDTWTNRANFYAGARGGVAIPAGAMGLAPSAGLEVGVANDFGVGFGLHVIWMNNPPGAPMLNVPEGVYGLGALADLRFYFPTIEPLTLYPSLQLGFVAGPALVGGQNVVLPLFNPGFGARVKFGHIYAAFEFGLAGFTIPFVTLSFGYQGDRRAERAERWARDQEELALQQPAPPPAFEPRPMPSKPAPEVSDDK